MVKTLSKLLLIFVVGGIGGIFFERTLVPWLAQREPFSRIPSLTIERTTIVNPTVQNIINEAQALEVATRSVYPTLGLLERQGINGEVLASASGAILTADGVLVTTNTIVGDTGTYTLFRERDAVDARFIAEDADLGIALFKAEVSGWPVINFVESRDLALGKRLFLLAASRDPRYEPLVAELQEGAITKVEGEVGPEVSVGLLEQHLGAPIFTIEGRMLGLVGLGGVVPSAGISTFFNNTDMNPPATQSL